jgi:hypothetical protein
MSSVPDAPPVRHGTCRLIIVIDDVHYSIRRARPAGPGSKLWRLKAADGPRAGAAYSVCSYKGQVACSCPDSIYQKATCKHIQALRALRLVNPRVASQAEFVARSIEGGA